MKIQFPGWAGVGLAMIFSKTWSVEVVFFPGGVGVGTSASVVSSWNRAPASNVAAVAGGHESSELLALAGTTLREFKKKLDEGLLCVGAAEARAPG